MATRLTCQRGWNDTRTHADNYTNMCRQLRWFDKTELILM